MPNFSLLSFTLVIVFWVYLIIYSYRHEEKNISPWDFSIVIIALFLMGRETRFLSNQVKVFTIDIALAVSLLGVLWNINNIRNLLRIRNLGDFFRYIGLGVLFGLLLGSYLIAIQGTRNIQTSSQTTFAFIAYVVQASLAEELLFRGYILGYCRKCEFNQIFSIVFQSSIFTLFHVSMYMSDWMLISQVFMVGITTGYLTWKENNLVPAFVLHIITNLMVIIWLINTH